MLKIFFINFIKNIRVQKRMFFITIWTSLYYFNTSVVEGGGQVIAPRSWLKAACTSSLRSHSLVAYGRMHK
jgi:hypothetical protein